MLFAGLLRANTEQSKSDLSFQLKVRKHEKWSQINMDPHQDQWKLALNKGTKNEISATMELKNAQTIVDQYKKVLTFTGHQKSLCRQEYAVFEIQNQKEPMYVCLDSKTPVAIQANKFLEFVNVTLK